MTRANAFTFSPDPKDSSPMYLQLARKLAQTIREGGFKPDEALPSERVLAETLNVSRVTARAAIDQLVEQDLIIRKRGSGNYIAPLLEQPLSRLTSFSEELERRGYTPSSRWLNRCVSVAMTDEQLKLGLSPGARVARLERLRLADDVVMAYEVSVLPQTVIADPMAVEGSLYAHLSQLGQAPVRALQHIRALNAHSSLAEQLGIADRQAVLFITR
ncbi:MAG: GntR family transcriptional regulator, partial [Candidatus Saccharibacteria bacterium]|nr:GntR family transcriptional regulator [Rhodoferax sp.]